MGSPETFWPSEVGPLLDLWSLQPSDQPPESGPRAWQPERAASIQPGPRGPASHPRDERSLTFKKS